MSGAVITFYSYKGGVGRSFALANVGVVLAQWGLRVLAVDWDIEAPGLENYFEKHLNAASGGVLDFLSDCASQTVRPWKAYCQPVGISNCVGALWLMPAKGKAQDNYIKAVQEIDWDSLFVEHDLGGQLETLRASWLENFDVVLIDSRTGVTDFSGITTAQLPDYLFFMFTANKQSLYGCCDVVRRAMAARQRLPVERPSLVPVPIPSRFEMREEYDRATVWRTEFSVALGEFYETWVPRGIEPSRLIDRLVIPYVPRWTFGEDLAALIEPAAEQGCRTPNFAMSYALETIAGVIVNQLGRVDLLVESRDEYVLGARSAALSKYQETSSSNRIDVFLSTGTENREVGEQLRRELLALGLSCWSYADLDPGENWSSGAVRRLSEARSFVAVIYGSANRSQQAEMDTFVRGNLRSETQRPILSLVVGRGSQVPETKCLRRGGFPRKAWLLGTRHLRTSSSSPSP